MEEKGEEGKREKKGRGSRREKGEEGRREKKGGG